MLLANGRAEGTRLLSRHAIELMTTNFLTPEERATPFMGIPGFWGAGLWPWRVGHRQCRTSGDTGFCGAIRLAWGLRYSLAGRPPRRHGVRTDGSALLGNAVQNCTALSIVGLSGN